MAKNNAATTPAANDAADAKNPEDVSSPMSGFVFGLLGAAIRKVEKVDDKEVKRIVGYRFDATGKDANGKAITIASYNDVEAPYPTDDVSAAKMAKDCRFTIVRRIEVNGTMQYVETKLAGLPAAVAIARDGRPVETLRGRVRARKISEKQLREAAIALYGFSAGDAPDIEVSAADLAKILSDEPSVPMLDDDGEPIVSEDGQPVLRVATAAEKLDAMQKMLAASGVKITTA